MVMVGTYCVLGVIRNMLPIFDVHAFIQGLILSISVANTNLWVLGICFVSTRSNESESTGSLSYTYDRLRAMYMGVRHSKKVYKVDPGKSNLLMPPAGLEPWIYGLPAPHCNPPRLLDQPAPQLSQCICVLDHRSNRLRLISLIETTINRHLLLKIGIATGVCKLFLILIFS